MCLGTMSTNSEDDNDNNDYGQTINYVSFIKVSAKTNMAIKL